MFVLVFVLIRMSTTRARECLCLSVCLSVCKCASSIGHYCGNYEKSFDYVCLLRWLGIHLAFVGNCFIFFATLFAVINRDKLDTGLAALSIAFSFEVSFIHVPTVWVLPVFVSVTGETDSWKEKQTPGNWQMDRGIDRQTAEKRIKQSEKLTTQNWQMDRIDRQTDR